LSLCGIIARQQYYLQKISDQVAALSEQTQDHFREQHDKLGNKIDNVNENVHDLNGTIQTAPVASSSNNQVTQEATPVNKKGKKPWAASSQLKVSDPYGQSSDMNRS
jgi:ABC-type transporter Mla subunit MlaD